MPELLWTAGFDRELQEVFEYLEDRTPGAGVRFLDKLDRSLGLLRRFPDAAPVFRGRYRRLVLRNGYAVYYQINGARIVLITLLHLSVSLETILRRLGDTPPKSS